MRPNLGFTDYSNPTMTASDLSFGSGTPQKSRVSASNYQTPSVALPTTAGDLNQPNSMFSIGQGFMDQADKASDAGGFDYSSLGGFGKTFRNQDGSLDLGAAGSVLQGLGGLGSLYLGYEAQ